MASGRKTVEESIRIQTKEERKRFLVSEKITYGCWNKLYRRSLVERAGVRYAEHVIYEEPLFVYPLLFYGSRFEIMAEAFYCYRQNEVGTMRRDMRQMTTLQMHADVQLAVWHFMKQTPFSGSIMRRSSYIFCIRISMRRCCLRCSADLKCRIPCMRRCGIP